MKCCNVEIEKTWEDLEDISNTSFWIYTCHECGTIYTEEDSKLYQMN